MSPGGTVQQFEREFGRGRFRMFDQMVRHPERTLDDVAQEFGTTKERVRRMFERVNGEGSYGKISRRKTQFREKIRAFARREARTDVRGIARALVFRELVNLGFSPSPQGDLILVSGGNLVAVSGSSKPTRTGTKHSKQRYLFFNVPVRHGRKPWTHLVAVAMPGVRDGERPTRVTFYVFPYGDVKEQSSIPIPVFQMKPSRGAPLGSSRYRPPHTGKSRFETYRNAWGLLK